MFDDIRAEADWIIRRDCDGKHWKQIQDPVIRRRLRRWEMAFWMRSPHYGKTYSILKRYCILLFGFW